MPRRSCQDSHRGCWSRLPFVAASFSAPGIGLLPRLGLGHRRRPAPASLLPLFGRSLRRTPLAIWGMAIAHMGVAVAILGMASDSAFTEEKLAAARPGERVSVGPWLVEFRQVMPVAGPNWTALEAELRASRGSGVIVMQSAKPLFPVAADHHQRGRDRNQLEWPALRRPRRARRPGPVAAPPVVEAVRDLDLARRRRSSHSVAHLRWSGGCYASVGSGSSVRRPSCEPPGSFLPLLVLAAFVVAVAWRLTKPADEEIRSQLVGQPVPGFALHRHCRAGRGSHRRNWLPASRA